MTRAIVTGHTWSTATVALYKSTFQPISDAFKTVLTQTTDTGQVNWTTLNAAPVTGIRDYEVYRFNDALQASAPIFIRVEYFTQNVTSYQPQFAVIVGTSTDGAGNLGGVTVARQQLLTNTVTNAITTPTQTSYVAGDGSQVTFAGNLLTNGTAIDNWIGFAVERFRNSDGTPNAEGYNAWFFNNYGVQGTYFTQASRVFALGATQGALDYQPPVLIPQPSLAVSFFNGATEYSFPFYTWGPQLRGASQALAYGMITDFPRCVETNVTHYGKTAKYLALGNAAQMYLSFASSNASASQSQRGAFTPLFRWE